MGTAEEVSGEFVVASGDAAPVFDAAPHALDPVAGPIGAAIVRDWLGAGCGRGDHSFGALGSQPMAQMVGIIAAVGDEPADRPGLVQKTCRDGDVVDVAGRQQEDAWPSILVGQRVELARPPAARGADRLLEGPPFPPAAERCALIWVLSIAAVP